MWKSFIQLIIIPVIYSGKEHAGKKASLTKFNKNILTDAKKKDFVERKSIIKF